MFSEEELSQSGQKKKKQQKYWYKSFYSNISYGLEYETKAVSFSEF